MWYRLYRSIGRNRWHTRFVHRFILIFTDFFDLHRKIHLFIKIWKLNSCKQLIFLTIKLQLKVEGSNNYHFLKKALKKSYLFFKTRFKIFLWLLILARFVGAQFFTIEICYPFKLTSLQFRVYHPGSWRFFFKVKT